MAIFNCCLKDGEARLSYEVGYEVGPADFNLFFIRIVYFFFSWGKRNCRIGEGYFQINYQMYSYQLPHLDDFMFIFF